MEEETRLLIERALFKHGFGVISCSGGKDSAAILHLCRDYSKYFEVFFMDRGDSFPHVLQYIKNQCEKYKYPLRIVKPPVSVLEYVKLAGLPTDIVPIESTEFVSNMTNVKQKLQSTLACCYSMFWQPFLYAVLESKKTLLLRGSKKSDHYVTANSGTMLQDIEICCPLWEWADEQVFNYINDNKIPLPHHYSLGVNTSMDCAECTGWLNKTESMQQLRYTKMFYPDKYENFKKKLLLVNHEVKKQMSGLNAAIFEVT